MALIVKPLPATTYFVNHSSFAGDDDWVHRDEPTLQFRSAISNPVLRFDLGSAQAVDTMAVVYSSNHSAGELRVKYGINELPESATYTVPLSTRTGCKVAIIPIPSGSYRYFQIFFDGTTENAIIDRFIAGKALPFTELGGTAIGAEQAFIDQSIIYSGAGWESHDEYDVLTQWKVSLDFIEGDDFRAEFAPFMRSVGRHKAFLFAPQTYDPSRWPDEAIFGRIRSDAAAMNSAGDLRKMELTIRSLS